MTDWVVHNTFYIYKRAVFASYMTISKDVSHQIVSNWNRYETGTDKPCSYVGPGRFTPDPVKCIH